MDSTKEYNRHSNRDSNWDPTRESNRDVNKDSIRVEYGLLRGIEMGKGT